MEDYNEKNFIFKKLVKDKADFIGSVGYVLYKWAKVEYINQYFSEKNKLPERDELLNWQKGECTETKIELYRKLGNELANQMLDELQIDRESQYKNRLLEQNKREKQLNNTESQIKNREKKVLDKEKELLVKEILLQDKEQHIKSLEDTIKNKKTQVCKLEKDIQNRIKFCHVKSNWPFLMGVLQSLAASCLFVIICFIVLEYLSGDSDIIEWLTARLHLKIEHV